MNRISRRTYFVLALALVLLVGMASFLIQYFIHAGEWATYPRTKYLYAKNINTDLEVEDRTGVTLYDSEDGYASYDYLRKAVLHITGDREKNIPSVVLDEYRDDMVGFNPITGLSYANAGAATQSLTISAEAQMTALSALNGHRGTVGVYNYKTGEILCAVSSPTFDPCYPPDMETIEANGYYNGVYTNRFFSRSYTPGSIFKLVTATAAIEELDNYSTRTWQCNGSLELSGGAVTCTKAHGEVTMERALAQSCNCVFAQIALELGTDTMEEYADEIGITSSISIDGYATKKGSFELSGASKLDIAWAGVGQGSGKYNDLINPCQFMTFMGAIANRGIAAEPYMVASVSSDDTDSYCAATSMLSRAMPESTANQLKAMMRNNVVTMYGAINVPNVCAKSGTAEVSVDGSVENTALFAGFIDSSAYPLAFIVVVEEGGAGSQTAAPVANAVLWSCINLLDNE